MNRHAVMAVVGTAALVVATSPIAGCEKAVPPISAIVFDVGGVLSKDMIDTKLIDLARSYNLDTGAVMEVRDRYRDRADLGQVSDDMFWNELLEHFGVSATPQDVEIDSYLELVDGTLDVAKVLSQTYRTAILSNDSREMSALRRRKFGFDTVFSTIVISAEVGVKKPDPTIYRVLLDRLGVPANECVFIDNNQANVDAAKSLGMQAIRFESAPQLREALAAMGISM